MAHSQHLELPVQVRASLGTAMVLGLLEGKLDVAPTTAYLMTYYAGKCSANCSFCSQARSSKGNAELLSRVSWPTFPTALLLSALVTSVERKRIKRVCFQALNYPQVFDDVEALVRKIRSQSSIPVSVSCQPQNRQNMVRLKLAGVDRLGIALDAATKEVFDEVKGVGVGAVYSWDDEFMQLAQALSIFGKGKVSTHIIVGLGETEQDVVQTIVRCVELGVLPALFAFTPIHGTALESCARPRLESYRRIQLARFLLVRGKVKIDDLKFAVDGRLVSFGLSTEMLGEVIEGGLPFQTSGCKDCNRPFYNERPLGPLYNYPRKLREREIRKIWKELQ